MVCYMWVLSRIQQGVLWLAGIGSQVEFNRRCHGWLDEAEQTFCLVLTRLVRVPLSAYALMFSALCWACASVAKPGVSSGTCNR